MSPFNVCLQLVVLSAVFLVAQPLCPSSPLLSKPLVSTTKPLLLPLKPSRLSPQHRGQHTPLKTITQINMDASSHEHRVFVSFPHIPVKLGIKILNTPEVWADRVAHKLSLPPVIISDVINIPRVDKDNTITCTTQYGPVTLTSLAPTHLVINIYSYAQIEIVLNEYSSHSDNLGFYVLVTVRAWPGLYVQGKTSVDLIPGLSSQDHLRNAVESVFVAYENYVHNITEIPSVACIELWRSLNMH